MHLREPYTFKGTCRAIANSQFHGTTYISSEIGHTKHTQLHVDGGNNSGDRIYALLNEPNSDEYYFDEVYVWRGGGLKIHSHVSLFAMAP